MDFNFFDWYYNVTDSSPGSQVWSTRRGLFVARTDGDYLAFIAASGFEITIDTLANLLQAINNACLQFAGGGLKDNGSANSADVLLTLQQNNPTVEQTQLVGFNADTYNLFLPQANLPWSLAIGRSIMIINTSSHTFTVKTFGGGSVFNPVIPALGIALFILQDNASQGGTWRYLQVAPFINATGGGSAWVSSFGADGKPIFTQPAAASLSDYAEGTFTPGLTFGGGSTGITFSTQTGKYRRIGNLVFVSINLVLTSKGSSTGQASITGLPFATGDTLAWAVSAANMAASVATTLTAVSASGATAITPSRFAAGVRTTLADTDFSGTDTLRFSGCYPI